MHDVESVTRPATRRVAVTLRVQRSPLLDMTPVTVEEVNDPGSTGLTAKACQSRLSPNQENEPIPCRVSEPEA